MKYQMNLSGENKKVIFFGCFVDFLTSNHRIIIYPVTGKLTKIELKNYNKYYNLN